MPTAIDLIGHNAALQEHWIRRFIAVVIDAIIIAVVVFIINIALYLFGVWYIWTFLSGTLWWLYSALFEAAIGGTVGKKLVSLHVVATDGMMDLPRALIRNISKIFFLFILIDLIVGWVTPGDPRQRFMDRIARTTVTRVDQQAYMEEQFRMMQHMPPHPQAPPPGAYPPPVAPQGGAPPPTQPAPPPSGWPSQPGVWPGQAPQQSSWPQHQWDESGQLKPEMKFCTACGGQLVPRGDGKLTCTRCGAVY